MKTTECRDNKIEVNQDGFLRQPELWNEDIAKLIANVIGIGELNENHWTVIQFVREYWEENKTAPPIRQVCQHTGLRWGQIQELFPMGPAKGACKIAGLPKPDGCV